MTTRTHWPSEIRRPKAGTLLLFTLLFTLLTGCGADRDASPSDAATCSAAESCSSTLVVTMRHAIDLADEPHLLALDTPSSEVRCSIPAEPSGSKSCFGHRFVDVRWDDELVEITLIAPFHDTDLNPEALPFETVDLRLSADGTEIAAWTLEVDPGEPEEPNGAGCPPLCWQATAEALLPAGSEDPAR